MEGIRLILKDGTVIENGSAGLSGDELCLWLPGWTMRQAAEKMLFEPSAAERIIFQYGDMETVYDGYTACNGLLNNGDQIMVSMVKGVVA